MPADNRPVALWSAPLALGPITATVAVPGSKSITNRALILAALGTAPSVITRPLVARDTALMIAALQAMGTGMTLADDHSHIEVRPAPLHGPAQVDCGLAGTLMRFLPPVATLAAGMISFDGDPQARERPLAETLVALRTLGAQIDDEGRNALPFDIVGSGHLPGGEVTLDASRSSQFVSGLLLSGARFDEGLTVRHSGGPLPSMPHITMTVEMLRAAGAQVVEEVTSIHAARWSVEPGALNQPDLAIEPDLSNASVFLAAAMVTGGTVTIPGWPAATTQPGDQIRTVFAAMGGRCERSDGGLTLTGPDRIDGLDIDLRAIGELTPTIAAVAALATRRSVLRGIGHLRGHETNRLAALVTEIERLGGHAAETEDGLIIDPRPLRGTAVHTYHDHRMATFAAIIGLVVPEVEVENIETTSKTLPDFAAVWTSLVATS